MDVGVNKWPSSICWMMQNYPTHFDMIYGFECCTDEYKPTPEQIDSCVKNNTLNNYTPSEIRRQKLYKGFLGARADPTTDPPTLAMDDFLREKGIKPDDFVVMKIVSCVRDHLPFDNAMMVGSILIRNHMSRRL